jgi:hypothetical protein
MCVCVCVHHYYFHIRLHDFFWQPDVSKHQHYETKKRHNIVIFANGFENALPYKKGRKHKMCNMQQKKRHNSKIKFIFLVRSLIKFQLSAAAHYCILALFFLCVHFIYFGSCAFAYCAVPKESQFPMR